METLTAIRLFARGDDAAPADSTASSATATCGGSLELAASPQTCCHSRVHAAVQQLSSPPFVSSRGVPQVLVECSAREPLTAAVLRHTGSPRTYLDKTGPRTRVREAADQAHVQRWPGRWLFACAESNDFLLERRGACDGSNPAACGARSTC